MDQFEKYASNTTASNGNQSAFAGSGRAMTGLAFIKVTVGGCFSWSFAYSDTVDSTFADGSVSRCNDKCEWEINALEYAVTDAPDKKKAAKADFRPLTFGGKGYSKIKGTVFTDPEKITAKKGDFICLRIKFGGKKIPFHPETIISVFRRHGPGWKKDVRVPLPVFSGVERAVSKRIAFIGDSITQGIGTPVDSYSHCAAVISEILGEKYAFWDMGIGYARGADAASDGGWLAKAKKNDIVTVCFGVNDMFQGRTADQIKHDLSFIVEKLRESGASVIIQTVPPFEYGAEHERMWNEINDHIVQNIAKNADGFFDTRKILCADGKKSPKTRFGGHPNSEGNRLWGEALAEEIRKAAEE